MAKTINSLLNEAHTKWNFWLHITDDELKDRNKTRLEAQMLAQYFEGRVDGLSAANRVIESK